MIMQWKMRRQTLKKTFLTLNELITRWRFEIFYEKGNNKERNSHKRAERPKPHTTRVSLHIWLRRVTTLFFNTQSPLLFRKKADCFYKRYACAFVFVWDCVTVVTCIACVRQVVQICFRSALKKVKPYIHMYITTDVFFWYAWLEGRTVRYLREVKCSAYLHFIVTQ